MCAVNLLPWTASGDVTSIGAVWHIFDPTDLDPLRKYLSKKRTKEDDHTDPVHAQQTYVTEEMLHELADINMRPYKIEQRLGDAVFIPAGCTHQVQFPRRDAM